MSKYCIAREGEALYLDCKDCEDRMCEYFYCLVVGSRGFTDYQMMKEKLDFFLSKKDRVVIVSGGAKGADTLAERYAKEKGYPLKVFPANWDKYGKRAGYLRNYEMQTYISKADERGIVAFWDGKSRGTKQNFGMAEKHGIPLKIVRYQ